MMAAEGAWRIPAESLKAAPGTDLRAACLRRTSQLDQRRPFRGEVPRDWPGLCEDGQRFA